MSHVKIVVAALLREGRNDKLFEFQQRCMEATFFRHNIFTRVLECGPQPKLVCCFRLYFAIIITYWSNCC